MTLQQEALIEAFALNPSLLSPAEIEQALEWIGSSSEASALFAHFEQFYQSFESLSAEGASESVTAFIQSITQDSRVVLLRPRRTSVRDAQTGTVSQPRLAAATSMRRAFELLGSNISDDGLINVRFIMDHEASRVRIYVVATEESQRSRALLLFQGSSILLMTDDSGQTSVERDLFDQLNLLERPILLRPVAAEFEVSPQDLGSDNSRIGPEAYSLLGRNHERNVFLSFEPEKGILFGKTTHSTVWKHVQPETCIAASEHLEQVIRFRLYA